MPITRAKSVDELYEDCRDYDLVLVPDPPLASALTRRLEEPHFGPFAITPRRRAAGRRERAEDRTAFLKVIQETDLDWKEAAYVIGNVLQCWEHQGDPEAILEHDGYATPATDAVLECMEGLDTTSRRLTNHRIGNDRDVAVVGIEEFTALERSILPDEYEPIDLLTDDPFEHPPFRIFESPAAIVDAILDSVTPENADRVAIVLDRGSRYSSLVEAALEAAEIPFYGGPGFAEDPDHRAFLGLLRTAYRGSDVRIAEISGLLEHLGADVDIEHHEKCLHAVDLPEVAELTGFCDGIDDCTFEETLEKFETIAGVRMDAFRDELDRLELRDEPVTDSAVGDLEFYVQTYEVPVERQNEGVLLADAKAASTVDRPAVFYLGMDEGWTHSPPRRPWVDREAEYTRNLQQFQRLLQNGSKQYYLVQDTSGGRPVTPCLYFEELLDDEFERFSDLEAEHQARSFQPAGTGFDREPLDVEPGFVASISQSSLNRLVNCPRDHLFNRLVDGPDRDYFAVGTLFHDFAEVYANHADRIDEETIDEVVDLMLQTTEPFDRSVDVPTHRTRYRIGLETISEFLDDNEPIGAYFLCPDSGWGRNAVADHLGLTLRSPHTEWWFDDATIGVKGLIDLVHSPTRLIDYKSGKRYSPRQVVSNCALDPPGDTPNFQALLYLTYLRSQVPDERLEFTFFHFLETLDDVITGDADLEDCLSTITYHPVPFEEYICREEVFEKLCTDGSADCRKTFDQLAHADIADVLADHAFPDTRDSTELAASELGEALTTRASDLVGEYKYVENGCRQALRHLRDIRDENFFSDDLDAFESFLEDRIAALNRYRASEERFPVHGLAGEPNYRRVDHRDMILEGDG